MKNDKFIKTNVISKDQEIEAEYNEFIRDSIHTSKYFDDAKDWYFFRYISPICDRTYLFIAISVLTILMFIIYQINLAIFPLRIVQPIYIQAKDDIGPYDVNLVKIKPKKGEANYDANIQNFDDSVIKFLLVKYIKDREEFDFRKGNVTDLNLKFSVVKNNSSFLEYKNFQKIMSKENRSGPIQYFGKNYFKTVRINNIKFYRKEPTNIAQKLLYFIISPIPYQADIRFQGILHYIDDFGNNISTIENFLAKINYEYQPIYKNDFQPNLNFMVNKYILYKIND
ncbi:MAG: VirB8/TrbF family protein [Rickettsiales bacterium]